MNAPTLPYRIMESVASSSFSLIALLLLPLGFGYTVLFLDVIRGIKLDFARLFDGFKDYGRILGTMLLTTVYTFLWTLLLVIPGIMKSYSYAMTLFILKDYPPYVEASHAAFYEDLKKELGESVEAISE